MQQVVDPGFFPQKSSKPKKVLVLPYLIMGQPKTSFWLKLNKILFLIYKYSHLTKTSNEKNGCCEPNCTTPRSTTGIPTCFPKKMMKYTISITFVYIDTFDAKYPNKKVIISFIVDGS